MPVRQSYHLPTLSDLKGRVCIVTGGNTGIGLKTVEHLALQGARVYIGARNASKVEAAIALIRSVDPTATIDIRPLIMDLTSLSSVQQAIRTFLAQEDRLHILVNNAGVMGVPFQITADDFEIQLQSNYIGHWLLTRCLTPMLLRTSLTSPIGAVRVVNVSSNGHDLLAPKEGIHWDDMTGADLSPMQRYGMSKLANVLHAKTLNAEFGPLSASKKAGQGEIWTASLHPGAVLTNLSTGPKDFIWGTVLPSFIPLMKAMGVFKTPDQGCLASLFCAAGDSFTADMSGMYFGPTGKVTTPHKNALDDHLRARLETWTIQQLEDRGIDLERA